MKMKIKQREIDEWLKSIPNQTKVFGFICLAVLFSLAVIGLFTNCWKGVTDWIFAFVSPGSTYCDSSTVIKGFALIVGLLSIVLTGIFISLLSNIIDLRQKEVEEGKIHYPFCNHVIIIGYNKMCPSLIKQISEKYDNKKEKKVEIVLQTVQYVPDIRHELSAFPDKETEKNVTLVLGSRTSAEDLEKLHPEHCHEIFILDENDEYDHDSMNIRCLELIRDIVRLETDKLLKPIDENLKKKELEENERDNLKKQRYEIIWKHIKPCHVLFEYQSTYAVFQRQDISDLKDYLNFIPFNFYECWAQKVLVENKHRIEEKGKGHQNIEYQSLDGKEGIDYYSPKCVHFVILGMSRMGVEMGIQAAHICHFPNFIRDKKLKTRITFIDDNADREMNFLKGRYPHLFEEVDYFYQNIETSEKYDNTKSKDKFTDIEFEFIKGRVENPEIQKLITKWANECDEKLLTIAVCFNQSSVAIAAGLYLPDVVYEKGIPVFVRQETSACTLSLLFRKENSKENEYRKYENIRPFGMLDEAYDLGKAEDKLPMRVNYVYNYFYGKKTYGKLPDTISENEMKEKWNELSTALKWSNRFNANMIDIKIRSLLKDKTLDKQTDTVAQVEHNRWCIEKLLMGYRQITDSDKAKGIDIKTLKNQYFVHTDICDFNDLSKEIQEIDHILSKTLYLIKG